MSEAADNALDFDLQTFMYSGHKYGVQVAIQNISLGKTIVLQNQFLTYLDYENMLNNLILRGKIRYVDDNAKLDKMLGEAYSSCHVKFWKEKGTNEKGNTNYVNGSVEIEFNHMFLIENVSIINRDKTRIEYEIDLISSNWVKLNKKLKYTNYHKDKEPITEIIKKLLIQAGFTIDAKSFAKNISPVKIHYITQANDTILTAINYLLRRMYYDKDDSLEDAVKFLAYSLVNDKIYLTNLSKSDTFLSETVLPMSCFDNSIEDMAMERLMQMASLNRIKKSEFYRSFERHMIYKYDPEKNIIKEVEDTKLCHKALMNEYWNNRMDDLAEKVHNKFDLPTRDLLVSGADKWETYWNNKTNIYDDMFFDLIYNDSLVVSVDGSIEANSGGLIGISIDRDQGSIEATDGQSESDLKERYKKFEGTWIVQRVRHIIEPGLKSYTNNLVLCRNWTPVITKL